MTLSIEKSLKTASEQEDTSLVIKSFILEKKNNPTLSKDLVFDITDNTISGPLKNFYFQAIPTFISNASTVAINEVSQISGSSTVDFRRGVTYTLTSATGTSRTYQVKILWDNNFLLRTL